MVREEKLRKVEELKELIEKFPAVGIADIYKFPSSELQRLRREIKDDGIIKVAKKSTIFHALKGSGKEGIQDLANFLPNQAALVFCKGNIFKFYSKLESLKFNTFIKEDEVAPNDIVVSAGVTNLTAGPVIGELSRAGIPVGIEDGKVAIKKTVVLVKKGEKVPREVANALRKLEIKPVSIGLNVVCFYENGKIYTKETLELVKGFRDYVPLAYQHAVNLSISTYYPTRETINLLLIKAFNNAMTIKRMGGV